MNNNYKNANYNLGKNYIVPKLSIIIPCYNEEDTLEECVARITKIEDPLLKLEIIIVDDNSTDKSWLIAQSLAEKNKKIQNVRHAINKGKGAAIRTGIQVASGDFIAIQDADLEYNPADLKSLIKPLINDEADVVIGSRFLSGGPHRVLYFWHSVGNKFLTLLSNMFTDLNLSDMESCYKVFKKDVIKNIEIEEDRFGFEPEIVAKVAHKRFRIFEMGISYYGRTYEEGKKIGAKDGFRALYCIFKYNAHRAPLPIQFLIYTFIGGVSALFNLFLFLALYNAGFNIIIAAPSAFLSAAVLNYWLSITLLFKNKVRWSSSAELMVYSFVVLSVCFIDLSATKIFLQIGIVPAISKLSASAIGLSLNFLGRKYLVFPEKSTGPWQPQIRNKKERPVLQSDIKIRSKIHA